MRAAILAGGKGTRIGGLYPALPKPMIPILGKPLLQWQIEALVSQGISDITLIVGYKADYIKSHFGSGCGGDGTGGGGCGGGGKAGGDGKKTGAQITYITEDEPLGTGGALTLLPREDTLIIYGDICFDMDLQRFIRYHRDKKAGITLFAHPNSHPHDSDIIVSSADGLVTAWKSKKAPDRGDLRNLVNAGLYVFSADALPQGETVKRDLEHNIILPALAERAEGNAAAGKVYAYRSTEYVKDMGTPDRLTEVEKALQSGAAAARNLKNKQRAVFLDRDGTINEYRGLLDTPEQIELIPKAAEAIRALNKSPYLAICVTNQPVIARGLVSIDKLDAIHARLDTLLGAERAYLDDLLYCPHHPDKGYPEEVPEYKIDCVCRKPKPGMLLEAAERYNIDLARSYMIGDSTADIAAGKAAGCKTIGVKTGNALNDGKYDETCDYLCENLPEAIEFIINSTR